MDLVKSIDFDSVAELYDAHLAVSFDHAFWLNVARQASEPRLELMCGTGRITLPLLQAGISVEGLDYSEGQLGVFKKKLAQHNLQTSLYLSDARDFSLAKRYELIFIGFHAIAEVVDNADKLQVFRCVHRHLSEAGEFWLSLHNPAVRKESIDGNERSYGVFRLPDSQEDLEVTGQFELDSASGIVTGVQRYVVSRGSDELRSIELPVRFHLIAPEELGALVESSGFWITQRLGDYDGSAYDPASSPYFLISCRRP
jgi:SAM-dependent methyltransferase